MLKSVELILFLFFNFYNLKIWLFPFLRRKIEYNMELKVIQSYKGHDKICIFINCHYYIKKIINTFHHNIITSM